MKRPRFRRVGVVVLICALAGALAGIAGSAAAPSKSKSKADQKKAAAAQRGRFFGPKLGLRGAIGGPPVHSETVVPNANGDGFVTVTMDNGKLKSIDGSKLTVTEGTDKATYGEPTIDVGDNPTVIRNHAKAALGDLKVGDEVHIIKGPKQTVVIAEDAAFQAQDQKEHGRFFRHRGRFFMHPGGPPGAWGPPPGAPAPGNNNGSDSSGGLGEGTTSS
jgi:hypothetical protein